MIIIQLMGGLGNQMFQYAFGRAISLKLNTPLKINIQSFRTDELREYELDCFNIEAQIALPEESSNLPIIYEKQFNFYEEVLETADNKYMRGYWQTEKYFKHIENVIRKDFTFKHVPSENNMIMLDKINDTNSVSIHIRRKDYVSNPLTNKIHGVCCEDYYAKAIGNIAQKVPDPHFYIFSDEPEWALNNFNIEYEFTVVDINDYNNGKEDLRLMSNCKHHIIANSSFSWWGAWLSENKKKVVIAPQKWFNDSPHNTKDIIPENWMAIY